MNTLPKKSSDETSLALKVLKRKRDELSIDDYKELKRFVVEHIEGKLTYIIFEGRLPESSRMYVVAIQIDEDITRDKCLKEKYDWIVSAFPLSEDGRKHEKIKLRVHCHATQDDLCKLKEELRGRCQVGKNFMLSTGFYSLTKWSKLPVLEQLKKNKKRVRHSHCEYMKKIWDAEEDDPLMKECPDAWKYTEICDVLGINVLKPC